MKMNIILVGMMGSGKSTVGKLLSRQMHWNFYDSDQWIEQKQGQTIAEIFKSNGENFFRKLEQETLQELCAQKNSIIATGGGAPCFEENWKYLQEHGWVVWLKARPETLWHRLQKSPVGQRPLLAAEDFETFKTLLKKREPCYEQAQAIIETDTLKIEPLLQKIIELYPHPL